jgi:hypothetical protein
MSNTNVYLEIGAKRTFAGAIDWPGWCRSGRDEAGALAALWAYGPRYAGVLDGSGLDFVTPPTVADLAVTARLAGNVSTDFGAPAVAPAADADPVNEAELLRLRTSLAACWRAFDRAAASAQGRTLTKGPRGGGRDLERMVEHVLGGEAAYCAQIAWKSAGAGGGSEALHQAVLDGLNHAVSYGVPPAGPRGGRLWTPRYFVRRVAWHVLDHAWEIEDRLV